MKTRWLFLILLINVLTCSLADETHFHKLVKRQTPPRSGGQRAFPLSRSRQFPPPEELEESDEYVNSEDEEDKSAASPFRGRQPQRPPAEDEYAEDYSYTEAPKVTTPGSQKPTARTVIFNNRFAARPKFGSQSSAASTSTTAAPKASTASTSRSRSRATPAQSQRLDVVANILNKPPPARTSSERSLSPARAATNLNSERKPAQNKPETTTRRSSSSSSRPRARGRFRTRSSTTTTTTTTTTEQPLEEYYYYYEDEEDGQKNPPIATTTTTTTTTTTPKPSLPKRVNVGRRPSSGRSTSKPVVRFDPESQFQPPPEDVADVLSAPSSTKKFSTTSTTPPSADAGGIPPHLRSKYKPRKDGRFIDFLRDPNRPRELKGFDLTDYPFYIVVPDDITFDCDDKKDGYYASIPHKCQLFHYCFAGARYDFLCANYTLYDQTTFTCRFANNVDCESSEKYYYRNDDLWKETTTPAPQTTTPKKKRTTPKEDDYEDYEDYEEYDEEERRRPPKRRRNRRKNRRKPQEDEEK